MDPDATLAEVRAQIAALLRFADPDEPADARIYALAESFDALDQWMSRGGFPPAAWRSKA